jgi:hypothetical protein
VITFNHTYLKYRIFENYDKKIEEYPFLINHEFILAGSLNIDEKSLHGMMNNKEILQLVKSKAQAYFNEDDTNMKLLFLENISSYAKEIGFENTIDLILPIVTKIVK